MGASLHNQLAFFSMRLKEHIHYLWPDKKFCLTCEERYKENLHVCARYADLIFVRFARDSDHGAHVSGEEMTAETKQEVQELSSQESSVGSIGGWFPDCRVSALHIN
jgi:hypothetical protein